MVHERIPAGPAGVPTVAALGMSGGGTTGVDGMASAGDERATAGCAASNPAITGALRGALDGTP